MLIPAQLALPILIAFTASLHTQDVPSKAAAARQVGTPATTTTPAPTASSTAGRGKKHRAGSHGAPAVPVPTAATNVRQVGGSGEDSPAIDPLGSSLSIPGFQNAFGVKSGTPIHVRLKRSVESGHARNGDMLDGVLVTPLGSAPAGAAVSLTVVSAVAAGTMASAGELSVQVISVGGQTLLSNVITVEGERGTTLMPDGRPARGTEASLTPDKTIELPAA